MLGLNSSLNRRLSRVPSKSSLIPKSMTAFRKRKYVLAMSSTLKPTVVSFACWSLIHLKDTKQLQLDTTIYDSLQTEKVLPGNVMYIEANSGKSLSRRAMSSGLQRDLH